MLDTAEESGMVEFFEMQVFLRLLKKVASIIPQLEVFQEVMKHAHLWPWCLSTKNLFD